LSEDHGEFKSIRIDDRFRAKGNGIRLINHLIDEAKKLNIKKYKKGHYPN
jgi:putative acetyltransferase